MATMAEGSGIPMIKCSSCHAQVEMHLMGDHSCGAAPPVSHPGRLDRLTGALASMSTSRNGPTPPKKDKTAPSQIDPFAASSYIQTTPSAKRFLTMSDRPFSRTEHPGTSKSGNVSAHTQSSAGGSRSSYRTMLKSAASPFSSRRSPSPNLALAQEMASPIFNAVKPPGAMGSPAEVSPGLKSDQRFGGDPSSRGDRESLKPEDSSPRAPPSPQQPTSAIVTALRKPNVSAANRPLDEIGSTSSFKYRPRPPRSIQDPGHGHSGSTSTTEPRNGQIASAADEQSIENAEVANSLSTSETIEHSHAEAGSLRSEAQGSGHSADSKASVAYHTSTDSLSSNDSSLSRTFSASSRSSQQTSASSSYGPPGSHTGSDLVKGVPDDVPDPAIPMSISPRTRHGPGRSFSPSTHAGPIERLQVPGSPRDPSSFKDCRSTPRIIRQQDSSMPLSPQTSLPQLSLNESEPPRYPPQSSVPQSQVPPFPQMQPSIGPSPFLSTPILGQPPRRPPLRRMTTSNKGNCRGCGEIITGKSVSSADGRLTGRYHKQCFVCRTCEEPFRTADFYILDNHPYCSRHYHTLNDTLCSSCDRGIEGPYHETDQRQKFHPHCFTCKECRLILESDYFDVNGIIYCEQHAQRAEVLGPGRRYAERRTTRLMMM